MNKDKRNCPKCDYWWFDRQHYGCSKGHKNCNTSLTRSSEFAFGPCKDDTSKKDSSTS